MARHYQRRRQLAGAVVIFCLVWQLIVASAAVAASITVEPTSGPPGTAAELSGSGFTLFIDVMLCWDRSGCDDLGRGHVNSQGRFGAEFPIPDVELGFYHIYACQLIDLDLTCTSTTFQVTSAPTTTTTTTSTTSTTTTTTTTTAPTTTTSSTTSTTEAGDPTTTSTTIENRTTSTTTGGGNPTTTSAGSNPATSPTSTPSTVTTGGPSGPPSATTSGGGSSPEGSTSVGGIFTNAFLDPPLAAAPGSVDPQTPILPFVPEPEGIAPFVPTGPSGGPSYLAAARDGTGDTAGAEWWAGALMMAVAGAWWARRRMQ